MKPSARLVFGIVLFCFFVSGAAGLVYQIVWSRYLALFLGHTSYAIVAVLVSFMGGLAIGNAWFGRLADRAERPLALYGLLEIGITLYAIVFPHYFSLCHDAYLALGKSVAPGSGTLLLFKFVFSILTIVLPTIMMGATFPVLTRFATRSLSELRERVAALYSINSAGAVIGVFIAQYWWVPAIGLEMTVYAAAGLNLVAGIAALYLSSRVREGRPSPKIEPAPTPGSVEGFSNHELRLAIVAIGLSGFVAMLYEVAWTRLLALALGSSTHAFSLMLVTFITGIAFGSWLVYRWKSSRNTLDAFAWAELALAGSLLVSLFLYEYLPYWFAHLADQLSRKPGSYASFQFLQAMVCFGVMFVPTVCLGATLPLASRIATSEFAFTGSSVGRVFCVNTVGTVLGTIITGLWLLPAVGLAQTFAIGIAFNALIGLALLKRADLTYQRSFAALGIAAVFVWLSGTILDDTWKRAFSIGLWRSLSPPEDLAAYRTIINNENLIYHRDGAGSTVSVIQWRSAANESIGLKVNGKPDASTELDVITQRLLGHIPMLLHPESRDTLVVGLGSGMTCASVARHPSVERVDVVEISPEVVEAARFFKDYNDAVLDNPKLHLTVEDAKSFLKLTQRSYDIIISEPSNPWMAGVAGVFSLEYYENCREKLKPGGLMAQWVQIYESSEEMLDMVIRTFSEVFPHTSIWRTAVGDLLLIGTLERHETDLDQLVQRFHVPAVQQDLESVGIVTVPVLLACQIVSQENGRFVPGPTAAMHSDFFPSLERLAEKAFFVKRETLRWIQYEENQLTRPRTLLKQYLDDHGLTDADYKAFGRFYLDNRIPEAGLFRSLVMRWQREQPEATLPMEMMAQVTAPPLNAELEALRLAPLRDVLVERAATDPEPLRMYTSYLMQTYRYHRSVFNQPPTDELKTLLERLLETNPRNQRIYKLHLAEIAWDLGDDNRCFELAQSALDPNIALGGRISFALDQSAPRIVLARMAESLWHAGTVAQAWAVCESAIENRYTGSYPLLDLTCRKIEAAVLAAPGTIRPQPQTPPAP
ncbi:MAG: fused MFS/spermidine synthase [Verrucomicrobia bacterium]|nr:fused MFS/spermidine synthase [Verrucomicrobiota bacterium]